MDKSKSGMIGGAILEYRRHGGAFEEAARQVERVREIVDGFADEAQRAADDRALSVEGVSQRLQASKGSALDNVGAAINAATQAVQKGKSRVSGASALPEPPPEAAEIRARIASASSPAQAAQQHLDDPEVMAAILATKPVTSGLTPREHGQLRQAALAKHAPKTTEDIESLEKVEALLTSLTARPARKAIEDTHAAALRRARARMKQTA